MKTSNRSFNAAFRMLLILLTGLLTTQFISAQGWYDSNWQYRMPVTVANPGSSHLSGFQVQIILTGGTEGNFDFTKAKSDGSDIRVTSDNGTTLIPFWTDGWGAYVENPRSDTLWVKVPNIPLSGTTVYVYYGNSSTEITDPSYTPYYPFIPFTVSVTPEETPPAGPFTKHPDNPVIPIGRPVSGADVLMAENIVYDGVTGHYWMALSNQTGVTVSLIYSDDPANPDAWYWPQVLNEYGELGPAGPAITDAISPHLIRHNDTWYIFYGDRNTDHPSSNGSAGKPISIASSSSVSGPYTYVGEALPAGLTGTWESGRVDAPYVFQRTDGKWVMFYMGETGVLDQVGYAIADNLTGPYTKYTGNPCLAFDGTPYDAGIIANPWVYEYKGVYYIGYTASPTTTGWSTALATTEDWTTFTKVGILLDLGTEVNSFRGAVTRVGDQYVFPYTANNFEIRIATQPVYVSPSETVDNYADPVDPLNTIIDKPEAVFDFYDGFDIGTDPDLAKWGFTFGSSALTSISNGLLTINSTSTYVRIDGLVNFGMNYIVETYGQDPMIPEANGVYGIIQSGFVRAIEGNPWANSLRITDNFNTQNSWQRNINGTGVNIGTADINWHKFGVYRESPGTAGFRIDDNAPVEVSAGIPTADMAPFLMSFGNTNSFIVDWIRVRKWAGSDPSVTLGVEETDATHSWTGTISTDWHNAGNWAGGVPGPGDPVLIPGGTTYQPVINAPAECYYLTIANGATLEVSGTNTLTVSGTWSNLGGAVSVTGAGIISVMGNLISSNGTVSIGTGSLNVNHDVIISGGTVSSGSGSITVGGNWEYNSGTFTPGTGTVILNGLTQAIKGSLPTSFNNLTISSYGTTILGINTGVAGDLSVTSGVFDIAGFSSNRLSPGGIISITNGAVLKIGGTGSLPSNFTMSAFGTSSVVEYYGTAQTVTALDGMQTYGNIVLSGGGARLFAADVKASGNISISAGVVVTLTTGTTSTAGSLLLGGVPALEGSYGSSTSPADNKNDTYFAAFSNGIINHSVLVDGSWMGGISTDWHTAANWVGGVPGANTDVIIPGNATYHPEIAAGNPTAVCRNLTINANASLTIVAGVALTVSGNLANSGILIIESGLLSNGSLIVNGASTGSLIYNRRLNTSNNRYHYFSAPLVTASFPTTSIVWTFDEPTGAWTPTTICTVGHGYTIQRGIEMLSFTGTMETSINTPVNVTSPYTDVITALDDYGDRTFVPGRDPAISGGVYGGGGWNLLGNPYTSAIRADAFITANSSQFDPYYLALYLFDGTNYRYIANTTGWPGGSEMDVDHIQTGQGFFILAMNNSSVFTFSRAMQEHATNVLLLKSSASEERWPGLLLRASYGSGESQTSVVYNSEMSTGLDPGYDVGQFSSGSAVNIYTTLVQKANSVNFARQALPTDDADKTIVPVGVDTETGGEVTFSAITLPLGTNRFWLHDKLTGIFTDLTTKSYTVTLPANTYGTGRFFIIASANTPTAIKLPDADIPDVRIWAAYNKVIIKGEISDKATCEIFSLEGKLVVSRRLNNGDTNTIDLPSGLQGVFMVKVTDGARTITRKVPIL